MRKKSPVLLLVALLAAVVVLVTTQLDGGIVSGRPGSPTPTSAAPTPAAVSPSARASLEAAGFAVVDASGQLVVSATAVEDALADVDTATQLATGYDRDRFGQRWADIDRNGCDTRNDVLARDLVDVTFKPGTRDCVVLTGVLHDPYTGTSIPFTRGEQSSQLVQIDHVKSSTRMHFTSETPGHNDTSMPVTTARPSGEIVWNGVFGPCICAGTQTQGHGFVRRVLVRSQSVRASPDERLES